MEDFAGHHQRQQKGRLRADMAAARVRPSLSGRATPIGGERSAQRSAAASPLGLRSGAASPHLLNQQTGGGVAEESESGAMDKLLDCERTFATLKREGRHLDALPYMEMSVFLRKQIYGGNSREVLKACQVFTTSCNTLAMNCLQKDDYMRAYELLKKAELLTEPRGYLTDDKARLKLRAVTFNNLGCFYKRRGKLHAALQVIASAKSATQSRPYHVQNHTPLRPHGCSTWTRR